MNDLEKQERLLDLLTLRETAKLSEEEKRELEDLFKQFPDWADDDSIALTAAAINLSAISADEEMPSHLQAKILADSERFFGKAEETKGKVLEFEPRKKKEKGIEAEISEGFLGKLLNTNWLGWGIAAAACLALVFNLWLASPKIEKEFVYVPATPTPTPALPQQREQFLASAKDVVTTSWSEADPQKPQNVEGDIVWSNAEQKGYVRFKKIPVNDKAKESYQLWIFDENQDTKTPIDGGVFDVDANGDVIIPINAPIKVQKPIMFAVTAEKPGGVVVSKREKIMAIAKVST